MLWTGSDIARPPAPKPEPGGRARPIVLPVVDCRAEPFTALVASWNVDLPPGSVLSPAVRVRVAGRWSAWNTLAHWGSGPDPNTGEPLPRSLGTTADTPGPAWIDIDTLKVKDGRTADAFQMRLWLRGGPAGAPRVRLLAVATRPAAPSPVPAPPDDDRPPIRLPVPARSQRVEDPTIAGDICSPTSVAMVLAFYGIDRPTAEVARGVFDHGAGIYGNWPFNTAYAATANLRALVRYFGALEEVEAELRAGRPVILSLAWEPGELPEAPIPRSAGHLIVATGVDERGDFCVNDPAADPRLGQPIARVYGRAHLARAFLDRGGVGYLLAPDAPAA